MVVSLLVAGLALLVSSSAGSGGLAGWVTLVFVLLYVVCFAFSLGPLAWVVISEIFPLAVRGRAASLATSANWFANFAIALSFPVIVGTSPTRLAIAFFGYAVVGLASIWFMARFVPETKDKSLEEIEESLRGQDVGA